VSSLTGDWRHRGRCIDVDPELFFPAGIGSDFDAQVTEAKAVCACCHVRTKCLAWALNAGAEADYGIWGGLTERERRTIRRERRRATA
jgi:WhiB family transcriptional regulator, redox-sensing transcriptional regulator